MKHKNLKTAISSVVISLAIYVILSFMVVMLIYEGLFARVEASEYHPFLHYEDMNSYNTRDVSFDSEGMKLVGKIYGDNADKLVILAHAKGGTGEDMLAEAQFFLDNGFSAMVFDCTGCGQSDGSSQLGLQRPVTDLENAVDYAKEQGFTRIYLYGMGTGGYAAGACADYEGVSAVAAVSAFGTVPAMTLDYATEGMGFLGYLEYPIMLLYQYIVFGSELQNSALDGLKAADVPVVVVNGTADETVRPDKSALIGYADKISNPMVSYITVDGGRHKSLMRTEAANALLDDFNREAYSLSEKYGGEVPTAEIEAFYAGYSREAMSEPDIDIMNEILSVFSSAETAS